MKIMKVLIADDHCVMRKGVSSIVSEIPSVTVVDEAVDGRQALSMIKSNGYDLIILDISMPQMSGLDVLQNMKDSGIKCRSLIVSLHPESVYASRAFKLGSVGYISKSASFDEIKTAVHKVISGGRYVSAELAEQLAFAESKNLFPHEKLSEREFQVMVHLAKGKGLLEIAKLVSISAKTVSTYRTRILKKMGMKSNADITIYAMQNNLIIH